jgi:hypothetical protein
MRLGSATARDQMPRPRTGRTSRARDTGRSAARTLTIVTAALAAVGATVTWVVPAGQSVRNRVCGSGPDRCGLQLDLASDLGRCRVISHVGTVPQDAVVFAEDLDSVGGVALSRTIDQNAVVTWSVEHTDSPQGITTVYTFADEAAARDHIAAVLRRPGRDALEHSDGSGLTALLGDDLDGYRANAVTPSLVVTDLGRRWDATPAAALVEAGTDGAAAPVRGGPVQGEPTLVQLTRPPQGRTATGEGIHTLWELGWAAAGRLGLAAPGGDGRMVMGLARDRIGDPARLNLEAVGELDARLAPRTEGSAQPAPFSLAPSAPPVGAGSFPGRLTITLDLTQPGMPDLGAALTHLAGAPVLATPAADATGTGEERTTQQSAAHASGQAALRTRAGIYRMLDSAEPGLSITVNTFRMPTTVPDPPVLLGRRGHLTIAGALPAADFHLARGVGFVKWQECEGGS